MQESTLCQYTIQKEMEVSWQEINEELKMKLLLENWNTFLNEAHGLSQKDLDYVRDFADETDDKELKRILKFIVKSNVLVDKTQDVTKMKKKEKE